MKVEEERRARQLEEERRASEVEQESPPDQLEQESISRSQDVPAPSMGESMGLAVRLLVSPAAGRLRLLPATRFHEGEEWISRGQTVALVEQGSTLVEVNAPSEARVAGVLVRDGEPVARGQPLIWLDEVPRRTPPPRGSAP